MAGRRRTDIKTRFEEKFRRGQPDECWIWLAARKGPKPKQYGHFRVPGETGAHRMAWRLYVGPIPEGMHVLHKCDVPLCVNPAHLFLGDPLANNRDAITKGRHSFATQFQPQISEQMVSEIRQLYDPGKVGYLKLAKRFGISASHVRQLIKRTRR
jgi:hypothetical protein